MFIEGMCTEGHVGIFLPTGARGVIDDNKRRWQAAKTRLAQR